MKTDLAETNESANRAKQECKSYQEELRNQQAQLDQLEAQVRDAEGRVSEFQDLLAESNRSVDSYTKLNEDLRSDLENIKKQSHDSKQEAKHNSEIKLSEQDELVK